MAWFVSPNLCLPAIPLLSSMAAEPEEASAGPLDPDYKPKVAVMTSSVSGNMTVGSVTCLCLFTL